MALVAVIEDDVHVHATIALVDGEAPELHSLYAWLQRDEEFRGQVKAVAAPAEPGDMGGVTEILTVALGGGGTAAVLVGTLSAWISARRTKISVDITVGDTTRRIEIDAANAAAAAQLFHIALDT